MPPPPMAHPGAAGGEPSMFDKMKMGAFTGGMVGLTIGFIFGSFAVITRGAGPKGFLPSISTYMLSSGATFAFFMSIGSVIRTDGLTMNEWAQLQIDQGKAVGVPTYTQNAVAQSPIMQSWRRRGQVFEKDN
ncbi:Mgr2p [Sporobolomyces salmoneus]|uniref:Mgr2p n=1 Tax=Sporobolomyces salmoneus TaxID=183962 RepID=UPI00317EDFB2